MTPRSPSLKPNHDHCTTRDILLRPLAERDAAYLARWKSDPSIDPIRSRKRTSPAAELDWLRQCNSATHQVFWGLERRDTGQLIGYASVWLFSPEDRKATLMIYLGDKTSWGRGYGTQVVSFLLKEAFTTLDAHRVELEVVASNHRAIALYNRFGFKFEGRLREAILLDSGFVDLVLMSLLRHEWHFQELPAAA